VPTGIVKESANGSAYLLSPIVVNMAWIEHGKAVYNTDKWGHRCPLAWAVGVSGPITMGLTSSTALKVPQGLNIPGRNRGLCYRTMLPRALRGWVLSGYPAEPIHKRTMDFRPIS